jgi:hypothetical protein
MDRCNDGGDEGGGGNVCNAWKKTDYPWFKNAKEKQKINLLLMRIVFTMCIVFFDITLNKGNNMH